jgi:hypothetical protein
MAKPIPLMRIDSYPSAPRLADQPTDAVTLFPLAMGWAATGLYTSMVLTLILSSLASLAFCWASIGSIGALSLAWGRTPMAPLPAVVRQGLYVSAVLAGLGLASLWTLHGWDVIAFLRDLGHRLRML